jgi:hypothetical protein
MIFPGVSAALNHEAMKKLDELKTVMLRTVHAADAVKFSTTFLRGDGWSTAAKINDDRSLIVMRHANRKPV